jgi:hypothetical protein
MSNVANGSNSNNDNNNHNNEVEVARNAVRDHMMAEPGQLAERADYVGWGVEFGRRWVSGR